MFNEYLEMKEMVNSIITVVDTAINCKKCFDRTFLKTVVLYQKKDDDCVEMFDLAVSLFEYAIKYAEECNNLEFEFEYSTMDMNNFDSIRKFIDSFYDNVIRGYAKCDSIKDLNRDDIKKCLKTCEKFHPELVDLLTEIIRVTREFNTDFDKNDIENITNVVNHMSQLVAI